MEQRKKFDIGENLVVVPLIIVCLILLGFQKDPTGIVRDFFVGLSVRFFSKLGSKRGHVG